MAQKAGISAIDGAQVPGSQQSIVNCHLLPSKCRPLYQPNGLGLCLLESNPRKSDLEKEAQGKISKVKEKYKGAYTMGPNQESN